MFDNDFHIAMCCCIVLPRYFMTRPTSMLKGTRQARNAVGLLLSMFAWVASVRSDSLIHMKP